MDEFVRRPRSGTDNMRGYKIANTANINHGEFNEPNWSVGFPHNPTNF